MKAREFQKEIYDEYKNSGRMIDWAEMSDADLNELIQDILSSGISMYHNDQDFQCSSFKVMGVDVRASCD